MIYISKLSNHQKILCPQPLYSFSETGLKWPGQITGEEIMRIVLCCAAGMSTSMLVSKMQHAALGRGLEIDIKAVPVAEFERILPDADVVLLGPQVQFEAARLTAIAAPQGKSVAVIDMMDYGMMRGEQVLDKALALHTS
jgi:PTS system cellobiose-specific IIB component